MTRLSPRNPFATCQTRPGQLRFVFRSGECCETLWARFQKAGRRGQIIGPHGTGKSTLVLEFTRFLGERGIATHVFRGRPGSQHELMAAWRQGSIRPGDVVAIDGYDQLPISARLLRRFLLAYRCVGLVVTTHREATLPVLYRTQVDLGTARMVLRQVWTAARSRTQAGARPDTANASEGEIALPCSDDQLNRLLDRHRGNLREALFELYDRYQGVADG